MPASTIFFSIARCFFYEMKREALALPGKQEGRMKTFFNAFTLPAVASYLLSDLLPLNHDQTCIRPEPT